MLRTIVAKYNRFGGVGLIKWLIAAIRYYFYRSVLKRKYLERKIFDFKLSLDLSDLGISRQLVINGKREEQLRYILQQEVKRGMTILDIGGNIGYYPIMEAKLVGDEGRVYTVEPAPENYKQLMRNIDLNDMSRIIEPYNIGMSNKQGIEQFYLSSHSNLHTFIKKGFQDNYVTLGVSDEYVEVEVTDLSTFLQDKRPIDMIRMDVEGYEVEILEGLEQAIREGVFAGKIIFECHFPKYDDRLHSMKKPLNMLFNNNYRVKMMTSNNESISRIRDFGCDIVKLVKSGNTVIQGVYTNIAREHAITLICELGGVRDVLFAKEEHS